MNQYLVAIPQPARLLAISSLVVIAILARFLPHPDNFTPVGAVALFAGTCLSDRRLAFLVPIIILTVSDLFLGLHILIPVVYFCFMINVLLGRWLRERRSIALTTAAVVAGSVQFFVLTNFACWLLGYPHTLAGLAECYLAAVPFFRNMLLGDLFFAGILFSVLAVLERGFPTLREPALTTAPA